MGRSLLLQYGPSAIRALPSRDGGAWFGTRDPALRRTHRQMGSQLDGAAISLKTLSERNSNGVERVRLQFQFGILGVTLVFGHRATPELVIPERREESAPRAGTKLSRWVLTAPLRLRSGEGLEGRTLSECALKDGGAQRGGDSDYCLVFEAETETYLCRISSGARIRSSGNT